MEEIGVIRKSCSPYASSITIVEVVYTIMDMVAGYWQVRVRKEDIPKIAFVTVWGQYEYLRIPFGLCNVPATFQRLMNHVLHDHLGEFVMVYLDDVVIYSKNMAEHV